MEKYQKLAEEIPDAGYNIRLHYPQEVLDELKAELSAIDREENNGSDGKRWYTTNQLCTETSKSYPWVKARLEKYQKLTEEMLDAKNNLRVHYPQEVLDKLLSELQNNGD